jgi:similar to stage IV sporulation protein
VLVLTNVIAFLGGYLEILVRGSQLEKFINLTTGSGLSLWEIKRLGVDVISVKMRAHGFFRMRRIARRSGCQIKICHKNGWPFARRRIAGRKLFLVGGVLFCVGLIYLASFIWFVRIEGVSRLEQVTILKILHQAGLRPGESRRVLLAKKSLIEREFMLRLPKVVWLGINLKGIVAEVKVVPRKIPPVAAGPADLVADCDGLITKVIVIRGVPLVREGDTVIRNQLLISGTMGYNDVTGGASYKEAVTANGIVEAKTWRNLEIIEPKKVYRAVKGKDRLVRYGLRWGHHYWSWAFYGKKPVRDYFWQRQYKQIYRGRNLTDGVELIKDVWEEVTWRKCARPSGEIRHAALLEAERRCKILNYPAIDPRAVAWTADGNFLRLQVTLEAIRDIAKVLPR